MADSFEEKLSDQKSFRIPLILGVLAVALILVGSSVVMGSFARSQTKEAVNSLTEFYLEELEERRTDVVTANLNDRILQMKAAVAGAAEENLESETSLREYLSFIQTFNNLDMFALVDEDGMVYNDTSTYAGISRFGFLEDEITETVITASRVFGNKNMVIIAVPVENLAFRNKSITACVSGIIMDNILSSISMQTDQNQTYCNIFFRDGRFLTKTEFGDIASQENLLTYMENNVDFDEDYSLECIKKNLDKGDSGFTSFMSSGRHDYLYYRPIEGTDWYLAIFISENIIDDRIENIGRNFIRASMIQIAVIPKI